MYHHKLAYRMYMWSKYLLITGPSPYIIPSCVQHGEFDAAAVVENVQEECSCFQCSLLRKTRRIYLHRRSKFMNISVNACAI